jgi:hypothetical protein
MKSTRHILKGRTTNGAEPASGMIDDSRYVNNGTFSNTSWYQLPSGMWAMDFNGTTSYVEMADHHSLRMTRGGTIAAWIYPLSDGEDGGNIINKSTNTNAANGYFIAVLGDGKLLTVINAGTSLQSTVGALAFSTWNFITLQFSSSGRKFYVNGVDVTLSGGGETALPPNVAGVVHIGNRASDTDRTFDGYIGRVTMYEKVLTTAEILAKYNAEKWWYGL